MSARRSGLPYPVSGSEGYRWIRAGTAVEASRPTRYARLGDPAAGDSHVQSEDIPAPGRLGEHRGRGQPFEGQRGGFDFLRLQAHAAELELPVDPARVHQLSVRARPGPAPSPVHAHRPAADPEPREGIHRTVVQACVSVSQDHIGEVNVPGLPVGHGLVGLVEEEVLHPGHGPAARRGLDVGHEVRCDVGGDGRLGRTVAVGDLAPVDPVAESGRVQCRASDDEQPELGQRHLR